MESYHGTSSAHAAQLQAGNVDVALGGGELGQGFYTGEYLYLAKAWALHVSGDKQKNVVQFASNDNDFVCLDLVILEYEAAFAIRKCIKKHGLTRTYKINFDAIWSPIVGKRGINGNQIKWESKTAEVLLNSNKCTRSII